MMRLMDQAVDFFLHLDHHIHSLTASFGPWTYVSVLAIIFCETGLVVTPFLPGDSLLFVLGALAAKGTFGLPWLLAVLSAAAILGNMVNYAIGRMLAPRVFNNERLPFLKEKHLARTREFYAKYGA